MLVKLLKLLIIFIPLIFHFDIIFGLRLQESMEIFGNSLNIEINLKKYDLIHIYSLVFNNNICYDNIKNNINLNIKKSEGAEVGLFTQNKYGKNYNWEFILLESMIGDIYNYKKPNQIDKTIFGLNNNTNKKFIRQIKNKISEIFFIIIISNFPNRIWGLWSYKIIIFKETKIPSRIWGTLVK